MDENLNLFKQMKTIDTITTARIKSKKLSNGSKKMTAPPLLVNKTMAVHRGLIFNSSNLLGKYESKILWKDNSIIDIYTTHPAGYWGSFYIQSRDESKLSQMLVTDRYLFALVGNKIVRYSFSKALADQFHHTNGGS